MDKGFSAKAFLPEVILFILISILLFNNISVLDIDPYSEFFHLEAAKESLAAGRFWTPLLNGHDYLVRAPLWTWLVTISFKLLGVSLFAARLPAVLLTLSALGLIYMMTLELTKSRFSAFFSAAVLATTWSFFALAPLATADILALNIYLGFLWAFFQWKEFASRRNILPAEMNPLSLIMGLLLGTLLLTSGPLSVLILGTIALAYLLMTQNTHILNRLNLPLLFLPLLLLPLPWLLWASIQTGKANFMVDYLLVYPIQKLMGGGLWQNLKGDWLFYAKQLISSTWPYLLFLPVALLNTELPMGNRASQNQPNPTYWLGLWFLTGFVIYSLSAFQEPTLLLPFLAPLAIITGCYLAQVAESANGKVPEHYEKVLILCIILMMSLSVLFTIVIFQIIPNNYVQGFWTLPGLAVLESFTIKDKVFPLPEAFPLWKFWLIPGPFVLLIGGFALFIMQAGRKLTLTPLALCSSLLLFLLFVKCVYLPIMKRPVPQQFAQQINRRLQPGDQALLYSLHPDIKRVLFYIAPEKLPVTHVVRDDREIAQRLNSDNGVLFGVIRERSYFNDLGYHHRTLLRVNQYNWRWDISRLGELSKLASGHLPNFDKMRSEILFFQSLPTQTAKGLYQPEEALLPSQKSPR
ncbi:ArnT family glycosyltransferase [Vampirovibrio sp.]|uniref:ArnT family glycosyltransferase n=1 Tax=Vampirovibrio sp. TaxID=2717857 RepID=UPI0035935A8F